MHICRTLVLLRCILCIIHILQGFRCFRVGHVLDELWRYVDDGIVVVDNGLVSTECPPWFGGDLFIDERQKVQLADIQRQPLRSYGKQNTQLFTEGYDEEASAPVKFGVADVAPSALILGKLIANGYQFTIGEHESYIAKDGGRLRIYSKGNTFVLRVHRGGGRAFSTWQMWLHWSRSQQVEEFQQMDQATSGSRSSRRRSARSSSVFSAPR